MRLLPRLLENRPQSLNQDTQRPQLLFAISDSAYALSEKYGVSTHGDLMRS